MLHITASPSSAHIIPTEPVLDNLDSYLLVERVWQLIDGLVADYELVNERRLLCQDRLRLLKGLEQLLKELDGLAVRFSEVEGGCYCW